MKIRSGFVSNSSSSSFIVIPPIYHKSTNYEQTKCELEWKDQVGSRDTFIVDNNSFGYYEFGWDYQVYNTFPSKLCFAYLQAREAKYEQDSDGEYKYKENPKWMKMLEEVLCEVLDVKKIQWEIKRIEDHDHSSNIYDYSYIDHQSSSHEGKNTEIFESKLVLRRFLFDPNARIITDNDNH